MADQQAKDDTARTRIISHMNADHHDSIVRYLQHYCQLPSWRAYDCQMTDISLDAMTFTCGGKTCRIPLEPPMSSFRDARERAVVMDKESLAGLNQSDIAIKEFRPPTGLYTLSYAIILATFICYSRRSWFEEGQVVERLLGPGFARFSWAIQPWLITFMVVAHSTELIYFVRNYLRKHSVNVRTGVWWQWVVTTFIEGQFAFMRFRELVEEKRVQKQKQKH